MLDKETFVTSSHTELGILADALRLYSSILLMQPLNAHSRFCCETAVKLTDELTSVQRVLERNWGEKSARS